MKAASEVTRNHVEPGSQAVTVYVSVLYKALKHQALGGNPPILESDYCI